MAKFDIQNCPKILYVNDASGLRLASAIVMEVSDEWQLEKTYVNGRA
jgi:hypothetical protein